jgi:hypothetical protein
MRQKNLERKRQEQEAKEAKIEEQHKKKLKMMSLLSELKNQKVTTSTITTTANAASAEKRVAKSKSVDRKNKKSIAGKSTLEDEDFVYPSARQLQKGTTHLNFHPLDIERERVRLKSAYFLAEYIRLWGLRLKFNAIRDFAATKKTYSLDNFESKVLSTRGKDVMMRITEECETPNEEQSGSEDEEKDFEKNRLISTPNKLELYDLIKK